jgi:hypothetical protein
LSIPALAQLSLFFSQLSPSQPSLFPTKHFENRQRGLGVWEEANWREDFEMGTLAKYCNKKHRNIGVPKNVENHSQHKATSR